MASVPIVGGSACLAYLYRYLCRSSVLDNKTLGGFVWVLEAWAYLRIPRTRSHYTSCRPVFPIAARYLF